MRIYKIMLINKEKLVIKFRKELKNNMKRLKIH